MELTLLLVTVAIGALIFYLWHRTQFFNNTDIPSQPAWPFIGNMLPVMLRKYHFVDYVTKYSESWPNAKYVAFFDFLQPAIIIRDLELIKSIAVKNFDNFPDHRSFVNEETDPLFGKSLFSLKGNKWREVRSVLSPAFTSSKMRQMSELMSTCAKSFADFLISSAKQGQTDFDVKDAFGKYTNDVIASCAFGIEVNTMENPNNDFFVLGKEATNFDAVKTLKMFLLRTCPPVANRLKLKIFSEKVTDFFTNIISSTIETRDKNKISRPDMIQLMMESRAKDGVQMDLMDMTAQAFIFFFGGFDTSSFLMSFTAIALSLNPQIQDRLIDDVDQVLKETNGNPSYDQINGMPLLEAILYETLRYYPIAGFLDRMCVKSFELPEPVPGGKPYTVKPGTNIWFPSHAIHQNPEYYPNPTQFDPDRFYGEKMTVNSPTFLAFGIGPRSCIGNRFALLQNKLVLFHILSKCRFEQSPKLVVPIKYDKSTIASKIEGGFWVKIVPRK